MPENFEQVTAQLTTPGARENRRPGARAYSLAALPGHAGFSYSFILERSAAGASRREDSCVRIAPARRQNFGPGRHRAAG